MEPDWNKDYLRYKSMFKGRRFPLAFVDLDRFDENINYVAETQKTTGKTIRVASKSIRCLSLIKRVFEKGGPIYQGVLAFTMEEAGFLFDNGLDNIVVAYPSIQQSDLALFAQKTCEGADICLMTDSSEHLEAISRVGEKAGQPLKVCLDIDMSYRPVGPSLHIGVYRSPLHSESDVLALVKKAQKMPGIKLTGLMGYEAQIASLNDNLPSQSVKNSILKWFKKTSVRELTHRRGQIVKMLVDEGIELEFVNGGGSGSLVSTGEDKSVTEVTAGSAFFAPGLFRFFEQVKFAPAAFFGLQVVRIPKKGMVTCQGGGYIGSGEVNENRLPWPVMPDGLTYLPLEGAGEVQTPLKLPKSGGSNIDSNSDLNIGLADPVFFQHAKAGELCERFNDLYLVKNGEIIGNAPTYRGQGKAFL